MCRGDLRWEFYLIFQKSWIKSCIGRFCLYNTHVCTAGRRKPLRFAWAGWLKLRPWFWPDLVQSLRICRLMQCRMMQVAEDVTEAGKYGGQPLKASPASWMEGSQDCFVTKVSRCIRRRHMPPSSCDAGFWVKYPASRTRKWHITGFKQHDAGFEAIFPASQMQRQTYNACMFRFLS